MTRPVTGALTAFTRPGSVALVGVSPDGTRPATRVLRGLLRGGHRRALYPVNPRYDAVLGVPCLPRLAELPEPPELTVVGVRAEAVLDTVSEAADAGARSFVVLSSGFAETGAAGAERERRLRALAEARDLRVLGPNSLGIVDFAREFYCFFGSIIDGDSRLSAGPLGLVTQSGAIGSYVYLMAQARGLALSHVVSTGNEVVLDAAQLATMLLDDERVRALALYTEGVRDGAHMIELCERAGAAGVPLVVLRAGDSERGRAAAHSHTGALAGAARVSDAVLARHGVVCVHTPEDLVTASVAAVGARPAPRPGTGLAVLTISGGGGVLMSDACARWGLSMARLAEATTAALREVLPPYGSPVNPVDLTATLLLVPDSPIARCMSVVDADDAVGEIVVFLGAGGDAGPGMAERILAGARAVRARCSVVWLGVADDVAAVLERGGVPVFRGVEECVRPMALMARAALGASRDAVPASAATAPDRTVPDTTVPAWALAAVADHLAGRPGTALDEHESKRVLELAGFTDLPARRVHTGSAAVGPDGLRYPVAVKVLAPDIPHKAAVGGVQLGVSGDVALADAAERVRAAGRAAVGAAGVRGVLVEEMAPAGVEVIVGMATDPVYGRVLAVGPGGVLAELIDEVTIVLPPATAGQVDAALRGTRLERLLHGHDRDALCVLVARLSALAANGLPGVRELDLNPVLVHRDGVTVVDCLVARDGSDGLP
jgi:acyl-CoA synthetase (NDP forming)